MALLEVRELETVFALNGRHVHAVDHVSFAIEAGRVLGLVGESGCGKSMTALSLMRLVPSPGRVAGGRVLLDGRDLLALPEREMRDIRGAGLAMIFQEPMTALNPVFTVGSQIAEALRLHRRMGRSEAWERATALLDEVGIPEAARRAHDYPHQLSGGMRQRVMIAIAISCEPRVLIADEPTTALDVTIQAQIVEVMRAAQEETDAAIILITHDLGLIAELADRVVVMYAGRVVELGDVFTIFNSPRHPYTVGLMNSLAKLDTEQDRLEPIPGQPPSMISPPPGCAFHPRCLVSQGRARCRTEIPELRDFGDHVAACHFAEEVSAQRVSASTSGGGT